MKQKRPFTVKRSLTGSVFMTVLTVLTATILLSACSSAKSPAGSGDTGGKLQVMASIYPIYDFALKIGGEKAEVTDMVPAGTEPHDWEPGTRDITGLEKADIFIFNGAGMEHWAEDVLESLDNQDLISVEASSGIALTGSDPHVWLAPDNARKEMENIKEAFCKADPENKEYYEANYKEWSEKLTALDQSYKDTLNPLPQKVIVVSHEAFGYLCEAYGLTQMGIEGLTPDSEPDPSRMAEIIDFVKENRVNTIFFEELASPKVAEAIAKETGAATRVLNPLEGLTGEEIQAGVDYFSVMEENLTALKEALEQE